MVHREQPLSEVGWAVVHIQHIEAQLKERDEKIALLEAQLAEARRKKPNFENGTNGNGHHKIEDPQPIF